MGECFVVMIIFCLIIFVGVIIVVTSFGNAENKRMIWKKIAKDKNLKFTPGNLTSIGQIHGYIHKHKIFVDIYTTGTGNNRRTYTRYRVFYKNPLHLGLILTRQGFLQNIKSAFGSQDIEVGNQAFDDSVVVKGKNPQDIIAFLTKERQQIIKELMATYANVSIEDNVATLKTHGVANNALAMKDAIEDLVELAELLTEEEVDSLDIVEDIKDDIEVLEQEVEHAEVEAEIDAVEDAIEEHEVDVESVEVEQQIEQEQVHVEHEEVNLEEAQLKSEIEEMERRAAEKEEFEKKVQAEMAKASDKIKEITEKKGIPKPTLKKEVEVKQDEIDEVISGLMEDGLDAVEFCNFLFEGSSFSTDMIKKFDKLKGQQIIWSATLTGCQKYFSDFNFRDSQGAKATFILHEIEDKFGSKSQVKAVLQLPESAYAELENKKGEMIDFSGTLLKLEPMMKEVYIADGELI